MKFESVIFDLNGTLVTFRFDVLNSRRALIHELTELGFNTSALNEETTTQAIFESAREQTCSGIVDIAYSEVRNILCRILDEFELTAFRQSSLFPSTLPVLRGLGDTHIPLAVVSNDGSKGVYYVLEHFKLREFFRAVYTRDDVERLKPHPDGIAKALKALNASGSKSIYVGDSVLDIMAARSAGLKAASVTGGVHKTRKLVEARPDYIVDSLDQLLPLLL